MSAIFFADREAVPVSSFETPVILNKRKIDLYNKPAYNKKIDIEDLKKGALAPGGKATIYKVPELREIEKKVLNLKPIQGVKRVILANILQHEAALIDFNKKFDERELRMRRNMSGAKKKSSKKSSK